MNVEGMRLKDVVWNLGAMAELDLLFDTENLDPAALERPVNFKVSEIVVSGALKLLLQPRRMTYTVTEDGVVLVVPFPGRP